MYETIAENGIKFACILIMPGGSYGVWLGHSILHMMRQKPLSLRTGLIIEWRVVGMMAWLISKWGLHDTGMGHEAEVTVVTMTGTE